MPKSKKRKKAGKGIPLFSIGTKGLYHKAGIPSLTKYSLSPTGVVLNKNGAPTMYHRGFL